MGNPGAEFLPFQRVVIGVGDLAVSDHPHAVLSTYALGSCVGVVAYCGARRVGGILHLMLPDSQVSPAKAAAQPGMFADTGLPHFFKQFAIFRVNLGALRLYVTGGGSVMGGHDPFHIGERNRAATTAYLHANGYQLQGSDWGGKLSRTLHLELATGILTIKMPEEELRIALS